MRLLLSVLLLLIAAPAGRSRRRGRPRGRAGAPKDGLGASRDTLRLTLGRRSGCRRRWCRARRRCWQTERPCRIRCSRWTARRAPSLGAAVTAAVVVIYRPLAVRLLPRYARRDLAPAPASPDSAGQPLRIIERAPAKAADADLFGTSGLQRRGSITRGITTGNRRDVSLESGLRLELTGEITDGVQLQAVLTDENTPIQPDGSTQRLSERRPRLHPARHARRPGPPRRRGPRLRRERVRPL